MEKDILQGFNSLASMIAEKVIQDIRKELPALLKGAERRETSEAYPLRKYVRGNKALAEWLGVSEFTVCDWKKKGVLDSAIKSEYGRVIIYDTEKAMECLNHKTLKAGRPRRAI